MVVVKQTGFTISLPEEILKLESHSMESLKKMEKRDLSFIIPSDIKENHEKIVYKVGFLRSYYKNLFPEMTYQEIYKIINTKWQVFKSDRQMERYASEYKRKEES